MSNPTGTLYVVATPIGNMGDITSRAIDVLKNVDCIAAEDTRRTLPLLRNFGIQTRCVACHDHNEKNAAKGLIKLLLEGKNIALVSDAGTPLISDPGFILVREAISLENVDVVPVPGPCAAIAALSAAGMPTRKFVFEGFLPAKQAERKRHLITLEKEQRTLVFYESSHRILALFDDLLEQFGAQRHVALAKEITKLHETFKVGELQQVAAWLNEEEVRRKGEFVVIVEGVSKDSTESDRVEARRVLAALLTELSVKKASKVAAQIVNINKNELYQMALELVAE
ncbi:16S rRNA (cytidine(1402)-2'-O)-methyltransferase [hydrothermal vent metagenome]|uniref:16S rRNA (Cytidine(1402)-2'-O)-methyltransferase n=1 Tax=hydrothermal vent metagenome TaxID=652676 RepID=A0A3B0Z529_9ZZZZ